MGGISVLAHGPLHKSSQTLPPLAQILAPEEKANTAVIASSTGNPNAIAGYIF